MDLQIVKEAFTDNPEVLLDELGLEYKVQSHRIWVLCPFHSDTHISNAIVSNGRFHCFACGATGDCFSLVQKVLGLSFPDAVIYCSEVYGLKLTYEENKETIHLRLSKKEQEALMFPKTAISLSKVMKTDAEAYKSIVSQQADKMIKKYQDIINFYGRRDAAEAYMVCRLYKDWSPNTFVEIKREATNRIQVLLDLKGRILK